MVDSLSEEEERGLIAVERFFLLDLGLIDPEFAGLGPADVIVEFLESQASSLFFANISSNPIPR